MGIQNGTAPDLFGLPEYLVNEFAYEVVGSHIRLACGIRRFGEVTWLYSVVMRAEVAAQTSKLIVHAAECAVNMIEVDPALLAH